MNYQIVRYVFEFLVSKPLKRENEKLQKGMLEYKVKLGDFEKLKGEYNALQGQKSDGEKEKQVRKRDNLAIISW